MAQLGLNRLGQVVFRDCTTRGQITKQLGLPKINATQMRTQISASNHVDQDKGEGVSLLLSKDETCFIAYHPDKEHPYKATRPVPKRSHANGEQSILKVDSKNMITKSPNLEQLQAITYTHRRHWFQYPGSVKRKRMVDYYNDNVDRPGLTS